MTSRIVVVSLPPVELPQPTSGWDLLDWREEFERQGVPSTFRRSLVNDTYSVCPSYPSAWWVPTDVDDKQLREVAKQRVKGRLPILTWHNPKTGSVLFRCAQPVDGKVKEEILAVSRVADRIILESAHLESCTAQSVVQGLTSGPMAAPYASAPFTLVASGHAIRVEFKVSGVVRALVKLTVGGDVLVADCVVDGTDFCGEVQVIHVSPRQHVKAVLAFTPGFTDAAYFSAVRHAAGVKARLLIVDCRSVTVAYANSLLRGGGVESATAYQQDDHDPTMLISLDLPNIHTMRASWTKLRALIDGSVSERRWLSGLSATAWLEHCRQLTEGAICVSNALHGQARSPPMVVMVHCSDGWDRTAQVCSLAQILLDPFYRTPRGLAVLVEKDWVSFGHRFMDRSGQLAAKEKSQSPIFMQWLFCLANVVQDHPDDFTYNTSDLMLLADLKMSGWSNSLAYNSEWHRQSSGASDLGGVSLWSLWLTTVGDKPHGTSDRVKLIQPTTSLKHIQLWRWCLRYDESVLSRRPFAGSDSSHAVTSRAVWWCRDSAAAECTNCQRDFGTSRMRRRHHCRHCGVVLCSTCLSPSAQPLDWLGFKKPQKICRNCVDSLGVVFQQSSYDAGPRAHRLGRRVQSQPTNSLPSVPSGILS